MSFDDDVVFSKFNKMEVGEASELVLSILLTSNPPERRKMAVKKLLDLRDNNHFPEIRSAYLNETHSSVKTSFIDLISELYYKEGIEFLKTQYPSEKDWKVRKKIINSVGLSPKVRHLDIFLEGLKDSNLNIKKKAIKFLGNIEDPRALESLMNLLQYGSRGYYKELLNSIKKIFNNSNFEVIDKYIKTGNIHTKRAVPLILQKKKSKKSVNYVISLLEEDDPILKINCLSALKTLTNKDKDTTKLIINELSNEDLGVKHSAIKALGVIGDKLAVRPLLELLKDKNPKTRRYTVRSLKRLLGTSKSIKRLQNLLTSHNLIERREAIILVGLLKDSDSLDQLISFLDSKNARIRRASYKSILKLIDTESISKIYDALKSKKWQIRRWSAKILYKLIDEENEDKIIESLLNLLTDKKSNVRKTVTSILSKLDVRVVINHIKELLDTSVDWKIRRTCIRVLIKIGNQEALKLLTQYIDDDDFYIQKWVIKAIGNIRNFENIKPIIDLLEDNDDRIKLAAIKSLRNIGDERVIIPLSTKLSDTNWDIRRAAEKALDKINTDWMELL
ncbi:MAG: hypothetical protein GF317_09215 [Candidatus Lokiarchaeota archaeon]|nr:hypothetical protein [Candidatus Lokiarchaeota archaeon]MBD3199890.1 hypothetical protein [Candidatus Lokiarchaeota archaeon]